MGEDAAPAQRLAGGVRLLLERAGIAGPQAGAPRGRPNAVEWPAADFIDAGSRHGALLFSI